MISKDRASHAPINSQRNLYGERLF